jgi:hypothetical protein
LENFFIQLFSALSPAPCFFDAVFCQYIQIKDGEIFSLEIFPETYFFANAHFLLHLKQSFLAIFSDFGD